MPTPCTRCDGSGFLNLHQIEASEILPFHDLGDHSVVIQWIADNDNHDVSVCDCCGNGSEWYGLPGEHYNNEDLPGMTGPYAYNGGLCECH